MWPTSKKRRVGGGEDLLILVANTVVNGTDDTIDVNDFHTCSTSLSELTDPETSARNQRTGHNR